jgi:DNA-directed RNA polymerase specialized sigma24 family protein
MPSLARSRDRALRRRFGGLSIKEVASAKEISVATVNRRWAIGKAWLTRELARELTRE